MELFCTLPFSTWPSFVLYSDQLTYIEYEASNIYTASAFQTRAKEHYFHSFHYISVWAETSLYQFRQVCLSASWSVGELAVGELVCRRVVHKPCVDIYCLAAMHNLQCFWFAWRHSPFSLCGTSGECYLVTLFNWCWNCIHIALFCNFPVLNNSMLMKNDRKHNFFTFSTLTS